MFRTRGENLRFVLVLSFLNIAFFLLEHQDAEKYRRLFQLDWDAVVQGQVWRLVTYQFTQAGTGFLEAIALFITLVLLYMMGSALEEEWGSGNFIRLFLLSTFGSACVAAWLGVPLLGNYFVHFTLLFVYAAAFPQQTLYLFGVVPVPVRAIALFAFVVLLFGVFGGGAANAAALGGATVGYFYYLSQRVRGPAKLTPAAAARNEEEAARNRVHTVAMHNAARYVALRQVLASGDQADVARLVGQYERDTVANVNICPPADFKPDSTDGYCMRCEGFAECSARFLRLNRPAPPAAPHPIVSSGAAGS